MSTTIDQKVVEMQFDNRNFEKNVSATMSTLDKLKQSLNLNGATKGLENIDAAARKIDLSHLSNAANAIKVDFSAMEVMVNTVLENITTSAFNAGKRIVSALTIDPIKTGFSEYETQINAVQTILANTSSKGTTIDDVNGALDKLNTYADKTIYNFTEMTRNIGTFTAAGIDLDKSVSAIQGIANLAAVSGSTSQQASTAMYQLSQALASGSVKLQDWNSVVNAGMGGQVFQDALKRTAKVMGTDVDALIKKYGSFRESLSKGEWLTTDVLTKTLEQFTMAAEEGSEEWNKFKKSLMDEGYSEKQATEILKMANTATDAATKVKTFTQLWDTLQEAAQSGWTQTWEILVGDFEEAKELLTNISNVVGDFINNMSNARNTMLQGWKDMGGRTVLIEALTNVFNGLLSIIKPVSEAFKEMFPAITSEQLYKLTVGLKELTKNFKISDETAGRIKDTFKGVFGVIKIGVDAITAVGTIFFNLAKGALTFGDALLKITSPVGDFFSQLAEGVSQAKVFTKAANGLVDFVNGFFDTIKNIGGPAVNFFSRTLQTIVNSVTDSIKMIGAGLGEAFQNGGLNSALDALNSGLLATILLKLKTFLSDFVGGVGNKGASIFEKLSDALDGVCDTLDTVRGSLETWQTNLKTDILLKIAGAVGILTLSLVVLSSLKPEKITESLSAITMLFVELMVAMSIASKFGGTGLSGITQSISAIALMMGMASAIATLAGGLKILSTIDADALGRSLLATLAMFAELLVATKILATNKKSVIGASVALNGFAVAMNIMALAMKQISNLSWDEIARGLGGIGGLLAELVIFANLFNPPTMFTKAAGAIIGLSTALLIMEIPLRNIATLSFDQIKNGLFGIAGAMTVLAVLAKALSTTSGLIGDSFALNIMAASLFTVAESFEKFKDLSWEQIKNALIGMSGALIALTGTALLMSGKNLDAFEFALPFISTSLLIIAHAMKQLGDLSFQQVAVGLTAVTGALFVMVSAMQAGANKLADIGNIVILAGAMLMIATAIKLLGAGGIVGVASSLVGLTGTLLILTAAIKIMSPMIGSMFKLAGSITTFSASLMVLGAAAAVVGLGLTTFVTSLAGSLLMLTQIKPMEFVTGLLMLAGAFTVIGVAATLLKGSEAALFTFAASVAALGFSFLAVGLAISIVTAALSSLAVIGETGVQTIITALTGIITGILGIIPQLITSLVEAGKALVLGLIDIIVSTAPQFIDGFVSVFSKVFDGVMVLLNSILTTLLQHAPMLMDTGVQLLLALLQGIAKNIGDIVKVAIEITGNFINGVASKIGDIIDAGINLIVNFINGMANGIRDHGPEIINAVWNLFNSIVGLIIDTLVSSIDNVTKIGGDIIVGLVDGITRFIKNAVNAAGKVVNNIIDTIKNAVPKFISVGGNIIDGLIKGLTGGVGKIVNAATGVAKKALNAAKNFLGINSPSKEFMKLGEYSDEGFAKGLERYSYLASDAAKSVGDNALDTLQSSLANMSLGSVDGQPTIRPVLDLSNIESGAKQINGMLGLNPSVRALANVGAINSMMTNNQNGFADDIVSAISDLKNTLKNTSGATYNIDGITYDDGSNITNAVKTIVRAAKVERRT